MDILTILVANYTNYCLIKKNQSLVMESLLTWQLCGNMAVQTETNILLEQIIFLASVFYLR